VASAVLVVNAGSSSIKFAVFACAGTADLSRLLRGIVDGIGRKPRFSAQDAAGRLLADETLVLPADEADARRVALETILDQVRRHAPDVELIAVGHRVVHGGDRFSAPVVVDAAVLEALRRLVPLAPLHEASNIAPIEALRRLRPGLRQVACFDTAFHRTQPAVAETYALPRALTDSGIRRYGFHGLSYEYVAGALPRLTGGPVDRAVIAHLGNGASMCAVRAGRSIATTMGFTALEGLPMGTRSGSIDPAIVLHLLHDRGMSLDEVTDLLYERSGLLGVSGISHDVRDLLASALPAAREALDLFVYRISRELGSLAAALGGLDTLVFTAGIGEHASPIRAEVCAQAAWLGVRLDAAANDRHGPRISAPDSRVAVWVIPTDEELVIARHTRALVGGA
jgi:acetate kinase